MTYDQIKIYEPDLSIKKGYICLWKKIIRETKETKWLRRQLFIRDLKGTYGQSFLGIAWALIIPLISLGTFIVLKSSGLFEVGDLEVPYAIYAILGLSLWQLFISGLQKCTNSLVSGGDMIKRISFPRENLVFASLGTVLIGLVIQMTILFILFGYYGYVPNWKIIFLPLMIIPILLLTVGLGLIFSIINGIMRDLDKMIAMGLTFLLFITPIAYKKPETGFIAKLASVNPLYYLSVGPRDIILTGTLNETVGYAISCILSVLIFFFCWMVFYIAEPRIAERI